jgi:hypothetical protein
VSNKFPIFYYISVETSILVFLLEPYEIPFEYTVLRGGVSLFYLSKESLWLVWRRVYLEIQAIADDITSQYVPPHVNIFDCGITLTCFWVQVATCYDFWLSSNLLCSIHNDWGQLWLASSSMVGKYDGSNDDFARISCISHRWISQTPRIHLGDGCSSSCIDCIFWCNRLFLTLSHGSPNSNPNSL